MGRELNHAEAVTFLGVYALDALDGDEREAVEAHVRDCGACQTEVSQHREVAAVLAAPGWARAPEGLWDRIAGSLEEAPPPLEMPLPPVVPIQSARRRSRPVQVAAAIAAVAAFALVGVLGLKVVDDGRRIDRMREQAQGTELGHTAEAALADPAARRVDMRSTDTRLTAQAVVLPDGTGYLVRSNLPELAPDRTYQLWALVGTSRISVGVLGPKAGVTGFKASGEASGFAITQEVAGGVVQSRSDPVVFGTI
jgi:anti-sigma factor RsiW